MRVILISLFFIFPLFSKGLENKNLIELFKNHYYTYICLNRWKFINKYAGKEDLLAVVGYACLKKHFLTPALDLAKVLRYTKNGRINATYLISLFSMKLFLIRYIKDGIDLNTFFLPKIYGKDSLIKIFNLTIKQHPKIIDGSYYFLNDNGMKIKVLLSLKTNEIIIFYYQNDILIKKDRYW